MTPNLAISPLDALFEMLSRVVSRQPRNTAPKDNVDDGARRAFVSERLETNGEAFSSEYDVQAMMTFYPDRF